VMLADTGFHAAEVSWWLVGSPYNDLEYYQRR